MKTPHQRYCFFSFLTLNIFHIFICCFHEWLWTSKRFHKKRWICFNSFLCNFVQPKIFYLILFMHNALVFIRANTDQGKPIFSHKNMQKYVVKIIIIFLIFCWFFAFCLRKCIRRVQPKHNALQIFEHLLPTWNLIELKIL